jgi:hypothetical protein
MLAFGVALSNYLYIKFSVFGVLITYSHEESFNWLHATTLFPIFNTLIVKYPLSDFLLQQLTKFPMISD